MPDQFHYDVFLSHSAKDKAVVRPLAERLRKDGVKVWFDEWDCPLPAGAGAGSRIRFPRHAGPLPSPAARRQTHQRLWHRFVYTNWLAADRSAIKGPFDVNISCYAS